MKKTKHGANVNYFAKKYNINPKDIIDFSSNINIFKPDINYNQVIENIKQEINRYPDVDYAELKKSISRVYKLKKEYITIGNGATEIINDILLIQRFQNIGIFNPTFSEYERVCNIHRKNVIDMDINYIEDMKYIKKMLEYDNNRIDLLILCNPNNPTGQIYNVAILLDFCKNNNIFLLVDETFIDFCYNSEYSLKEKIDYYDNVIVISAITKYYAMTGARLGYSFCSNAEVNKELELVKKPWNINILAEQIMYQLEKTGKDFAEKTKSYFFDECMRLYQKYISLENVSTTISSTCYICLYFKNLDVYNLQEWLIKKHNILIRVLDNYKNISNNSARIAIKEREKNDRLFELIKMYVEGDI